MLLSGQLSDWSVEDLLQMLHITKKTASLHVDGTERSGVVYFDAGAIVGAEVSVGTAGGDDREMAVQALYVLQLLDEGEFEIRNQVPPTAIDPMSVAEALELASEHLAAERALGESGLLGARGLRLAQQIDEPIILSERVWAAISVSIPAFTFTEMEGRMGRAAAVDTLEQFRELGVLEAVLDETADTEDVAPTEVVEVADPLVAYESGEDIVPVVDADTVIEPDSESPSMWMADETEVDDVSDEVEGSGWGSWNGDEIEVTEDPRSEWEEDDAEEPEEAAESAAPSSLSDAIRAAAAAAQAAGIQVVEESGDTDDESRLLAEASSTGNSDADGEGPPAHGPLRRTVSSLISSSDPDQVQGVLDDLGARFREASD